MFWPESICKIYLLDESRPAGPRRIALLSSGSAVLVVLLLLGKRLELVLVFVGLCQAQVKLRAELIVELL